MGKILRSAVTGVTFNVMKKILLPFMTTGFQFMQTMKSKNAACKCLSNSATFLNQVK